MVPNRTPLEIRIEKSEKWIPRNLKPSSLLKTQRQRLISKVRIHILRGHSVLIKVPRWSEPEEFWKQTLNGMGATLILRGPAPQLSLNESWMKVLQDLGHVTDSQTVLKFIAERSGFRTALKESIEELQVNVVLISNAERWPLTILDDLQEVWNEINSPTRIPLLISGALNGGVTKHQFWLPDLTRAEALDYIGVPNTPEIMEHINRSGGVPSLLKALKPMVEQGIFKKSLIDQIWLPVLEEVQQIRDQLSTDSRQYLRLVSIIKSGAQPYIAGLDQPLVEAGLIRKKYQGLSVISVLRAPVFAQGIN